MDGPLPSDPAAGLRVSVGQHSEAGRKPHNQDFHGLCLPRQPLLGAKGIAVALADGISSSDVGRAASETAVASFLEDYYSTPETWSVKRSAQRVMGAVNAWLHAQTQRGPHRGDQDRGYVCAMSVLVLKSATAHVLHVGDARIYRLRDDALEQLTEDHRVWLSRDKSCLARALGVASHLEIDYQSRSLAPGDLFLLLTDGVYEYVDHARMIATLRAHDDDLDAAARALARLAYDAGSPDNLTVQLVRVEALPLPEAAEVGHRARTLPCPPLLAAGQVHEGYRIVRELHASSRSHVYLAEAPEGGPVVLKVPSLDLRHDPVYLERLLMEEWVARRIDSRHVARACPPAQRHSLYTVSEYIEGRTLARWMADHPDLSLPRAIDLLEQVARGLQAFHRLEIVHRDLRPENLMVDGQGVVRIIDMGSAEVAGVAEAAGDRGPEVPGAIAYAAPEYFLGETGGQASDIYSLGVIAYQMLTGRLPYGTQASRVRTHADLLRLQYAPARQDRQGRPLPGWVDAVLARAVHPDPRSRYAELSEFTYALRHPESVARRASVPLLERHPVLFWKVLSLILGGALLVLLAYR
ncbi:bifunctional protein-serine/threonine kinase/phosphatase [Bordetella genomosp. 13]|uniref:Protein kinase n=1 Tax=Bordetella genomosp. 13 TaxID=463040 RepID=A0A1W6ZCE1_9BORD|nr:bifunctional protein-serine/threonine kinase/phosphatase [Bordetella genomosp. 13]ARP94925.1 protein kinase [Bordetella genomosp. 13]